MFLLYHSDGCNICELVLHECYVNDLYTITCSGMLGHHRLPNNLKVVPDTHTEITLKKKVSPVFIYVPWTNLTVCIVRHMPMTSLKEIPGVYTVPKHKPRKHLVAHDAT
jgi:hypothetical protein